MSRALVVALLLLLPAAPAAAQSYDSSFRFGLGLDYGGLFGRDDGGAGGLRIQLGARVHEYVAVYWQGQALGAGFVGSQSGTGMFLGWNAVLVELDYGIFQLGAGPSVDVMVGCEVGVSDGTPSASGCFDAIAPGLATRAALRFGMFTLSVDLHASFNETGTMVWGLMGIGMQLGDVPREPMLFGTSQHGPEEEEAEEPEEVVSELAWTDPGPRATRSASEWARLAASGSYGRALDDPYDPSVEMPPERPEPEPPPANVEPPERATAPVVRRFEQGDVRANADHARPAPRTHEPRRPPPVDGGLEFEGSDDPLEGLEGF